MEDLNNIFNFKFSPLEINGYHFTLITITRNNTHTNDTNINDDQSTKICDVYRKVKNEDIFLGTVWKNLHTYYLYINEPYDEKNLPSLEVKPYVIKNRIDTNTRNILFIKDDVFAVSFERIDLGFASAIMLTMRQVRRGIFNKQFRILVSMGLEPFQYVGTIENNENIWKYLLDKSVICSPVKIILEEN